MAVAFRSSVIGLLFFLNDTATTEIYTLSLHDALPISLAARRFGAVTRHLNASRSPDREDRKSTRLNSSHEWSSYAVFCLKKKKIEVARRGFGSSRDDIAVRARRRRDR